MSSTAISSVLLLMAVIVLRYLLQTEQPKIKGIAEIPGWPIVGNLLQLGNDHAAVCMKWAEKYGPVFQVR